MSRQIDDEIRFVIESSKPFRGALRKTFGTKRVRE